MDLIKINDVEISFPQQGETILVPIKPICEVLGIDHSAQYQVLKNHPLLKSVILKYPGKSRDNKTYQMLHIPLKYFFGWIFNIHADKVNELSSDSIIEIQHKVYDAIYIYFYAEIVKRKGKWNTGIENQRKELNAEIKTVKQEIEEIKITEPNQLQLKLT